MRRLDLTNSKDVPLMAMRGKQPYPYFSLAYNPAEHSVLLTTKSAPNTENSTYDLYAVPKEPASEGIFVGFTHTL